MLNHVMKLSSILFLFVALLFTSCEKDDILSENFTNDKTDFFDDKDGDKDGRHHNRCFELVFPITMNMPDGTSITGEDKESLKDQIKNWYENNPDVDEKPSLAYPVEVKMKEDDTTVSINNDEEWATLKETCREEYGGHGHHGERCLTVIYPVTINFPDGTSTSVDDRNAFKEAIRTWKENNPDATERPSLAYPVEVKLEDGTIMTVNSQEEMAALKEDCRGDHDGHHGERCFELVFPITMTLPDGTTVTGEDKESLKDQVKDWYENNPDADERPAFVYPIEVEMEDETIVTVNNQEELRALKEACDD